MKYAIPSRGRAASINDRTLATLRRLGVSGSEISVFVAPDEFDEYKAAVGDAWVVEGRLGMGANRHAILDSYPPGTQLVQIDDDISDIVFREDERTLRPVEPEQWAAIVDLAFRWCRRTGARLWGVYPVANAMFMKDRIRADLTYICGNLYGCVTGGDELRPSLEDKEDYERTLQCYAADGAVVRIEYVSTRTRFYDAAGGMQTDGQRTEARIRESADELVRRFPRYAKLNLTKRSGHAELRLRDPSNPTVTLPKL